MIILRSQSLDGRTGHAAGRELLAQMVLAHTGKAMPEIEKMPGGKPYFPGSELHFSISHTKHWVFCALSDRPVGIDAEELSRKVDLRLAEKVLSAGELAQFRAASDASKALLTFWVLKEAEAKCSGEGLRIYPNHTNFSLQDPRVKEIDGCLIAVIGEEDYAV